MCQKYYFDPNLALVFVEPTFQNLMAQLLMPSGQPFLESNRRKYLVGTQQFIYLRPKICCFFENLAVSYFMFTALHSADKFSYEYQILGLKLLTFQPKLVRSE